MPTGQRSIMRTLTFFQPQRLVFGCGCLAECLAYLKSLAPAHLFILTSGPLASTASSFKPSSVARVSPLQSKPELKASPPSPTSKQ